MAVSSSTIPPVNHNRDSGIRLSDCNQISINLNKGKENGEGITVINSTRIGSDQNTATGNLYSGIVFINVHEGTIYRSNASGNNDNGIALWSGCQNIKGREQRCLSYREWNRNRS